MVKSGIMAVKIEHLKSTGRLVNTTRNVRCSQVTSLCKVDDCQNEQILAQGMCTKHYKRWYRYGDPHFVKCAPNGDKKKHPLYSIYTNMKTRCYNENNEAYEYYGARGIKVCDEWLGIDGFDNFVQAMGVRPSSKHSIDRIDVNGDYTPLNCRWATDFVQMQNRRMLKSNKSGVTGVCWNKSSHKWQAYIRRNGIINRLGYYSRFNEAVQARYVAEASS